MSAVVTFLMSMFTAIASINSLAGYAQEFAAALTQWLVTQATDAQRQAISDAVALQSAAKTDADRYAAADAWQKVLAQGRVSS